MQSQTINRKPQPISTTLLCIDRFDLSQSLFSLSTSSSPLSSLSSWNLASMPFILSSVPLVETRQKHLV
ncbi:hypothetical protein LOK49_LG10G00627 [Camellia lanceoleosa]|uniref:Uncharacterized protein n=1 Tax=Camellia lanceoleosa TaxID=1840588 RepID=A0ACC0GCS7_9ERIC|nr:hypothetical protein LOK49_LG10G00627 [Camellia lanceoleosa]